MCALTHVGAIRGVWICSVDRFGGSRLLVVETEECAVKCGLSGLVGVSGARGGSSLKAVWQAVGLGLCDENS